MNIETLLWQPGWVPTNDHEVTYLMKYLSSKKKETDRVVNSAKAEISDLELAWKEAQDSYDRMNDKITALLERYVVEEVDKEDKRETKTQIKYKLARGEIIVSKSRKKLEKPDMSDELLLSAAFPNFVVSETKFQWAEFKKDLELQDDGTVVHLPTGKSVSVPVVESPVTTKINLKL
ncbi:host-nuclease inhibitor Gam family protein [Paenibacillus chitinolyticus]|uniref:host-nuclease inhibitor Gam family protein n=1 Tax=Paenibacillus chitinolyticus TaxID=79263 RepID=UPI003D03F92F